MRSISGGGPSFVKSTAPHPKNRSLHSPFFDLPARGVMHLTYYRDDGHTDADRPSLEIEVTPEMIEAVVALLESRGAREFSDYLASPEFARELLVRAFSIRPSIAGQQDFGETS